MCTNERPKNTASVGEVWRTQNKFEPNPNRIDRAKSLKIAKPIFAKKTSLFLDFENAFNQFFYLTPNNPRQASRMIRHNGQ
jgi:hypothetical protein